VKTTHSGYVSNRVLKFQVGFLLAEGKGHSSETELTIPRLRIADDLTVESLRGKLRFSRTSRGILVQGLLQAALNATCHRCLADTPLLLDVPLEELYVFPPEAEAEFTVAEDGILDLAPLLREETLLDIPSNILCRADCAGLCPECGQNLNEGQCDCASRAVDPRLAALLALRERLHLAEE
jgi:uncharacterized protein